MKTPLKQAYLLGFFLFMLLGQCWVEISNPSSFSSVFALNDQNTEVQVLYPNGGEVVYDTILIRWTVHNPPEGTMRFSVHYKDLQEPKWIPITTSITGISCTWDTRGIENGNYYVIRVTLLSVTPAVSDESDEYFTIDNGALPRVQVIYPNGRELIDGTVRLTWTPINQGVYNVTYDVYYWDGSAWSLLVWEYAELSYSWDTTKVPDGAYYRIKVYIASELGMAVDTSDGTFTIKNRVEARHAPSIVMVHPTGGEDLTGSVNITWRGTDPDGDPLTYSVYLLSGTTRDTLTLNVADTFFVWDTLYYPDGTYVIEVLATDGTLFASAQSGLVWVRHSPPIIEITTPKPVTEETVAVLIQTVTVNWTVESNPANYILSYEVDIWFHQRWIPLAQDLHTTTFRWDTRIFPNGDAYKLRVIAFFGPRYSEAVMEVHIANTYEGPEEEPPLDQNRPPEVELTKPKGGEIWNGIRTISYVGADPDGDRLTYNLLFWNGTRWEPIVINLQNSSYAWDISLLPSRTDYLVLVGAFDGTQLGVDVSDPFAIGGNPPQVTLLSPLGGEILSGDVTLIWEGIDPDRGQLSYSVECGYQGNWTELGTNLTQTSWVWNTGVHPNGKYNLRVIANNSKLTGVATLEAPIHLNNNFPPTVQMQWPNGGEVVNNTIVVTWIASDPNDLPDTLSFDLFYVTNDTWVPIAEGLNTTQFVWDTTGAPDLDWTVLRVQASDPGNLTAIDDSDAGFQISNISPSSVKVQPRGYLLLRKLLFFVVIPGLVLYIASMVVYGRYAVPKKPQQAVELKKNIQALETRLHQLKQRQHKIRTKGRLKKWPKKLTAMETRLVSLRAQNIAQIKKYIALKTLCNTLQTEINDHLQLLGSQVTRLLEILEETGTTITPTNGIGEDELNAFADDPPTFFWNQGDPLGILLAIGIQVRELIAQHVFILESNQMSPEPFIKERLEEEIITKMEKLDENQKALAQQQETPAVTTYVQARQFIRLEKEHLRCVKQINKLKQELRDLQFHDLS
ncbi:MAG: hypothetical protein ACE5I5_13030 [Candidatus Heimdallarchaeota archaeon]